jgi:outer membrane protein, heavy metal efflux system
MASRFDTVCAVCAVLIASACVARNAGQQEVRSGLQHRLGVEALPLARGEQAQRAVERLLSRPLDAETAAQVALLNSPAAELALGRLADGRAAALGLYRLPNPHSELAARFGGAGSSATLDAAATLDLTELILLGYRVPAAKAELRAAQADALRELLTLAHDAKRAFYVQQATLQIARLEREVFAATDAGFETAKAMHAAGNSNELEFAQQQAAIAEAGLRVAETDAAVYDGREHLRQVLGLWQAHEKFEIPLQLPALPKQEPRWIDVQQRAVAGSLDIEAATQRKLAAEEQHDGAWVHAVVPKIAAGVGAERDDDRWSAGPLIEVEVPLFYQGQAESAAHEAAAARADAQRRAAAIAVRAESRAALQRLAACRERVERYATEVLPRRREILRQALLQYNAMSLGVFQLLEVRRALTQSEIGNVNALRDYWLARTDLAQLLAGSSTGAMPSTAPASVGAEPPNSSTGH